MLLAPAYQALFHEETHAVAPKEWAPVHGMEGRPELVHVAHAKEDPIVREGRGPSQAPPPPPPTGRHASMLGLMCVPSARS